MEPPTTLPRRAATLSRLWRTTDVADCIGSYLPTKSLAVLPTVAQQFERDKWRSLVAALRQQPRRAVAECTGALLSALQMGGRDTVHLREDWADQARFDEKWTVYGRRRGGGFPEHVDYTARVSQGTLVMDRLSSQSSTILASRFNIPGVGDRCCIHRFRVALVYNPYDEADSWGSGFQLLSIAERARISLFVVYIAYENGSCHLRWRNGHNIQTLKSAPTQHTFLVDATLDWRTRTARVKVDGAEFEEPLHFRRLPVRAMGFECGEWPGSSTLGPVDVWYSIMPPPIPSARFEGDP